MKSVIGSLSRAVRALAQPAEIQEKLFPPFVVSADELALTFAEYYKTAVTQCRGEWTIEQVSALRALDDKLSTMSGPENEELWLEADSLKRPEWGDVRKLAKEVLSAFGWPTSEPPLSDAIYAGLRKRG